MNEDSSELTDRLIEIIRGDEQLSNTIFQDAGGNSINDQKQQHWWIDNFLVWPFLYAYLDLTRTSNFSEEQFDSVFNSLKKT